MKFHRKNFRSNIERSFNNKLVKNRIHFSESSTVELIINRLRLCC